MTGKRFSDMAANASPKRARVCATSVTKSSLGDAPLQGVCAKWCSIQQDGSVCLDETRVKCLLPQSQREDPNLMLDVVHGKILNARMYPLIFGAAHATAPDVVRLRTLPYFSTLLSDGGSEYRSLTRPQKEIVAVGLRDLYLAESMGLLGGEDKRILESMVQIVDDDLEPRLIGGMAISFYPSSSFSIIKFIQDLDTILGSGDAESYAQLLDTPKLFAVFVNPAELSYHNFENIVPLDSWIESSLSQKTSSDLAISFTEASRLHSHREIFTCTLHGSAIGLLKNLSGLDLYVSPLNKGTRGGRRFIFNSTLLSKTLTRALQSSGMLNMLAGGRLTSSFQFVNYVFRCNRFDPTDPKFGRHLDTPYYDGARSHVSKYTLLIYLTSGRGEETLRVEDVSLNVVQEMTCVIFDQRYSHEGRPFMEGKKIFLRSELIFKDDQLRHDHKIAELFAKACYMTGQSMFRKDLDAYAHECFERANSFRWTVEQTATRPPTYLHKNFQGISFLTNGFNYWFLRGSGINAKDCALVALLDYFNCKVGTQPFQSRVRSEATQKRFTSIAEIWSFLSTHGPQKSRGLRRLKESEIESLIQRCADASFTGRLEDWDGEAEDLEEFDEDGDGCCPMHSFPMFNPWKNNEVLDVHNLCCNYTRTNLLGAPLLILGQEVVINDDNIEIIGDKIFILQQKDGKALPPVNFAACWGYDPMPPDFVVVGDEIAAPSLLVPPVSFYESSQGYQLELDFFRNDWIVAVDEKESIPVPSISERPEGAVPFASRVPEATEGMKGLFEYWG